MASKVDIHRTAFYKAETRIIQKKEELFKQGNVAKWEIAQEELNKADKNLLLKSKEYAFSKMLTKVKYKYELLNFNLGITTCFCIKAKLCLLFSTINK